MEHKDNPQGLKKGEQVVTNRPNLNGKVFKLGSMFENSFKDLCADVFYWESGHYAGIFPVKEFQRAVLSPKADEASKKKPYFGHETARDKLYNFLEVELGKHALAQKVLSIIEAKPIEVISLISAMAAEDDQ